LAFAVDKARELFDSERLVVHSEIPIPNVQIPEVGFVGGTLDFMTAEVIGEAPMGNRLLYRRLTLVEDVMVLADGRWAQADPSKSVFIVVEAKRTRTLYESSSEAELIGQLKSQLIRTYVPQQRLPYPRISPSLCSH
jgi:hypothetical protein